VGWQITGGPNQVLDSEYDRWIVTLTAVFDDGHEQNFTMQIRRRAWKPSVYMDNPQLVLSKDNKWISRYVETDRGWVERCPSELT